MVYQRSITPLLASLVTRVSKIIIINSTINFTFITIKESYKNHMIFSIYFVYWGANHNIFQKKNIYIIWSILGNLNILTFKKQVKNKERIIKWVIALLTLTLKKSLESNPKNLIPHLSFYSSWNQSSLKTFFSLSFWLFSLWKHRLLITR